MATRMERILKEIREAKTVMDGLRGEVKAALEEAQAKLKEYDEDAPRVEEAIKLLDEMESGEAIAENTDGVFSRSGN